MGSWEFPGSPAVRTPSLGFKSHSEFWLRSSPIWDEVRGFNRPNLSTGSEITWQKPRNSNNFWKWNILLLLFIFSSSTKTSSHHLLPLLISLQILPQTEFCPNPSMWTSSRFVFKYFSLSSENLKYKPTTFSSMQSNFRSYHTSEISLIEIDVHWQFICPNQSFFFLCLVSQSHLLPWWSHLFQ